MLPFFRIALAAAAGWYVATMEMAALAQTATATPIQDNANLDEAPPTKPTLGGFLTITVYPEGYSHIEWYSRGRSFSAISNADLALLPAFFSIDTPDASVDAMLVATRVAPDAVAQEQQLGLIDWRGRPSNWPRALPVIGAPAQYLLWPAADAAKYTEDDLRLLNIIHRYYDTNIAELRRLWIEGEALRPVLERERALREEYLRQNPATVQFLRIERSGAKAARP